MIIELISGLLEMRVTGEAHLAETNQSGLENLPFRFCVGALIAFTFYSFKNLSIFTTAGVSTSP